MGDVVTYDAQAQPCLIRAVCYETRGICVPVGKDCHRVIFACMLLVLHTCQKLTAQLHACPCKLSHDS